MSNELSIFSFQKKMERIYGDKNRDHGFDYLFGYLCKNALSMIQTTKGKTKISEFIFIKTFSYIFAIGNYFSIDIIDAFIQKYPGYCPYCFSSPCKCSITDYMPSMRLSSEAVSEELQWKYISYKQAKNIHEMTFGDVFKVIKNIYPNNTFDWNVHGPNFHIVKLAEELGELHEVAIRYMRNQEKNSPFYVSLCNEIADVFAWSVSAWGLSSRENIDSMSKNFYKHYIEGCPVCKSMKCSCCVGKARSVLILSDEIVSVAKEAIDFILDKKIFAKTNENILANMRDELGKGLDSNDRKIVEKLVKLIHDSLRDDSLYTSIRSELEIYEKQLNSENWYSEV